jgi:glutathione S-transferase
MTGQTNWYRHYNAEKNADALKRYTEQTERCYQVLEAQLRKTDGKSVYERGYGVVDWHFYPWVYQHGFAGISIDKYLTLKKWLSDIGERPVVKRAYEAVPKGEKA